MTDLIDTTEMYLRTIYELIEDGIAPMRARIAEQLGQSGPTVSQTVARMERDGLVVVAEDRTLHLTDLGHETAVRVMRKHRLAERLLTDVIGLDLPHVHEEACRWEHVMSDRVERKVLELVGEARFSPYGNAIPGLEELGETPEPGTEVLESLADIARESVTRVTLARIGENPQAIEGFLQLACEIGLLPGALIEVRTVANGVHVTTETGAMEIPHDAARHLFVR